MVAMYWKSDGKSGGSAVETADSETPFKPISRRCMEWQCLRGAQANKKKEIWIGFCIH